MGRSPTNQVLVFGLVAGRSLPEQQAGNSVNPGCAASRQETLCVSRQDCSRSLLACLPFGSLSFARYLTFSLALCISRFLSTPLSPSSSNSLSLTHAHTHRQKKQLIFSPLRFSFVFLISLSKTLTNYLSLTPILSLVPTLTHRNLSRSQPFCVLLS